jgi:hypothetical protein
MYLGVFAEGLEGTNTGVKILAVLGGVLVGGGLAGFLTGLMVRVTTTKPMPLWPKRVVRVTGGIIGGWIVASLFGWGGGGGFWPFGGGGPGGNGGPGTGPAPTSVPATPATSAKPPPPTAITTENLRIEVLGPEPLAKIAGGTPDLKRCYRIETPQGKRLMTLEEVKDLLVQQVKREPPLRQITVIVYKDTSASNKAVVTDLTEWAADLNVSKDEKLKVEMSLRRDTNAPGS